MSRKIARKIYYRIEFKVSSALSVGSGENQYTEGDIIKDSYGKPFIPGTTLAGLYRHALKREGMLKTQEDIEKYFGMVNIEGDNKEEGAQDIEGQKQEIIESKVLVYDARIKGEKTDYHISTRDCVELDSQKTAIKGSKFDFEVVEPGAVFVTYLELNLEPGEEEDICEKIAELWFDGAICIGQKTMRGLGTVKVKKIKKKEFRFVGEEQNVEDWLDFDMYKESCWYGAKYVTKITNTTKQDICKIQLGLKQKGGISVRCYTTEVGANKLDYEQLVYQRGDNDNLIPFIPGTTWAGAFKHQMEKLGYKCDKEYFGTVEVKKNSETKKVKSRIKFSESELEGAKSKMFTHNAIDRFTNGVIGGAVFTEKTWYGGETKLTIEIPKNAEDEFKKVLAASIVDLHTGAMSVGGLTGIGRGLFEVTRLEINGQEVKVCKELEKSLELYQEIVEMLKDGGEPDAKRDDR